MGWCRMEGSVAHNAYEARFDGTWRSYSAKFLYHQCVKKLACRLLEYVPHCKYLENILMQRILEEIDEIVPLTLHA